MKSTDKSLTCEEVLDHVEEFIDGELPSDDYVMVERHLHLCTSCADEVAFARDMQVSLRAFSPMECPDRVVDAVYRHIDLQSVPVRTAERPSFVDMVRSWLTAPRLGPALAFGMIAVLALGVWLWNPGAPDADAAEVAAAKRQVEWTLAYLGSVNEKVTTVTTDRVLQPYVVEPVQRAVETALQSNATLE